MEILHDELIQNLPVMMWRAKPDMYCDFFSNEFIAFTGRTRGEELGHGWLEAVYPEDRLTSFSTWSTAFNGQEEYTSKFRLRHNSGEYRWVLSRGRPFKREGEFAGYIGLCTDIHDQVVLENSLRNKEAWLADAQTLNKTGSFRWNVLTGEDEWSDGTYQILDFDRGVVPTYDLVVQRVHPEDRTHFVDACARAAADRAHLFVEYRVVHRDGSVRYVQTQSRPESDETFVGAVQDVTERRQTEAALQRTQYELSRVSRVSTMGELAASIAHEINQPLGSALANAAAAARWLDTEPPELVEAKKTIQDILADVRRASDVIKSLRALTSKSLPSFTRFALNDATMQTIKLIKGELDYRKVSVSFDLTDDVEVLGDRVQIQQVILNLLLNAIEATTDLSERTGAIRLSSNLLADRRIKVCVEDNGPGVSEEARRHIFDAFYTTKPSGIGMGLSICRSIVEAHLGVLDHTPAEPVGSSFCFTLPLADQICIKRASIADVSSGPRSWFLQRSPNEDV